MSKVVDISRWLLVRRVDSKIVLQYRFADKLILEPGWGLEVYLKSDEKTNANLSNENVSSQQKIVVNIEASFGLLKYKFLLPICSLFLLKGLGEKIETFLFNDKGDEKASCIQTAIAESVTPN